MINQLLTFGGEWRHDKLKDPVNLVAAEIHLSQPVRAVC